MRVEIKIEGDGGQLWKMENGKRKTGGYPISYVLD
jgi:hypothetical protein